VEQGRQVQYKDLTAGVVLIPREQAVVAVQVKRAQTEQRLEQVEME
jgi:hypothetical protein